MMVPWLYQRAVVALLVHVALATPSPASIHADLTILMNNDLQGTKSPYIDSAVILLSSSSYQDAIAGCKAIGEQLWSPDDVDNSEKKTSATSPALTLSIQSSLNYLVYRGQADQNSRFWVAPSIDSSSSGTLRTVSASGHVSEVHSSSANGLTLATLCTQSAPLTTSSNTSTAERWQVSVHSNNEDLVGFRDRTSFRFYGIRYAEQPERFTYSTPYLGSQQTVSATAFGSECAQGTDTGSEDCLFLNIWTPYLPHNSSSEATKQGGEAHDSSNLRPVMVWIHGGGFLSGTGSDNTFDGGSLASRGDVVCVTINYRLSTLGFLALADGSTNGNYGIADQVTALDWIIANIADFGGDASRITIFGQSAGAGSIRALMASPQALGKFAGAIPQSNLGGLGYGTSYSEYYTIAEDAELFGDAIVAEANCTNATSQVDCLRQLPPFTLLSLPTAADSIVQDGTYISTGHLALNGSTGVAPYKLLMGTMREDNAALISYPATSNETAYLQGIGWPTPPADLFPIPTTSSNQTLNLFEMTARYTTDGVFRCIDEATVLAGLNSGLWNDVYYYEMERSYQLSDWPNYDVCQPPITATHPYGDPREPYLRCHSGDLYEVFGNIAFQGLPFRDAVDLPFEQMVLDSWTAFARTYDPNPDEGFLTARGYTNTSAILKAHGKWEPATKGKLALRALAWPPYQGVFREREQCDAIGLPLTYYE
ncbi:Alpha/Beta hydrolase protein [Coniella lustricola]|uniref:Alpha/Beta hydrolase protein n=1 Tax=Coniella lustricola TaxID=2025994 RepID=A0A2T3AF17_9PEZI|nr:Alpha/Beta hydrolase protein [Coniella lustricola]